MHTAVNDSYGTLGIPNTGIRRLQEYESTALMHSFYALGFRLFSQAGSKSEGSDITARCPQKGQKHEDDHGRGYQGDDA